jgi:hypothetical protein
MAILVEEEKNGMNWIGFLVVLVIVGLIAASVYYLFFAPTPLIEVIAPPQFQSISQISSFDFNVSPITNSPIYQSLRQYVGPLEPAASDIGRANPFQPF